MRSVELPWRGEARLSKISVGDTGEFVAPSSHLVQVFVTSGGHAITPELSPDTAREMAAALLAAADAAEAVSDAH